ncbi:hypothetical protein GCM10022199_07520 [Marihabitans asiaticum]|uniref:Uncharacterized protein n=1 Tax=Marihabitans asiaticum TaxID=415218 RepID=A0A560WDA6_9MICO|nr:hypothetical protein [Marihabitans asiaticum]TWD15592.1 hypothetical protein FB557_1109 [Marihabitans asiaticum]
MRPSPVPQDVATELDRATRRWQQLPLDRAVAACPGVHALLADLVGEPVPDLGPAVVIDQLRAIVFEIYDDPGEGRVPDLANRLTSLRLSWSQLSG